MEILWRQTVGASLNPSSGNLHPTEGLFCVRRFRLGRPGLIHYLSRDHVLERRAAVDDPRWTEAFPGNGVLIGVSSIYWREAWKYGMRAWRYCQHDCGHAIATVSYAAAALGWQSRVAFPAADEIVAGLLGLDRSADFESAEGEAPDVLLWVSDSDARPDLARALDLLRGASWHGRANPLSREQVHCRTRLDSRVTHKLICRPAARTASLPPTCGPALTQALPSCTTTPQAVEFDGLTSIGAASSHA